jgi:uncharacterized OB-fold protein
MPEYKKPLPAVTASNRPFWGAARRHELVACRCLNCGTYYSQVTDCVACGSPRMDWVKVSGRGQVFTFCIFHRPFHPAWKDDIPYNAAYVKLDEGPLVITNIVECANEDIRIGMKVEVVFEDVTEEITLPKFRPVK